MAAGTGVGLGGSGVGDEDGVLVDVGVDVQVGGTGDEVGVSVGVGVGGTGEAVAVGEGVAVGSLVDVDEGMGVRVGLTTGIVAADRVTCVAACVVAPGEASPADGSRGSAQPASTPAASSTTIAQKPRLTRTFLCSSYLDR